MTELEKGRLIKFERVRHICAQCPEPTEAINAYDGAIYHAQAMIPAIAHAARVAMPIPPLP